MDTHFGVAYLLGVLRHKVSQMIVFIVLDIENFLKALEIELIWNVQ